MYFEMIQPLFFTCIIILYIFKYILFFPFFTSTTPLPDRHPLFHYHHRYYYHFLFLFHCSGSNSVPKSTNTKQT